MIKVYKSVRFAIWFSLLVAQAAQTQANYFFPQIESTLKVGNQRSIGRLGVVLPLLQKENAHFYLTSIGMLDSKSSREGNFGFGYRHMYHDSIWGAYGFYDLRRTPNRNLIHQLNIGLEYFRECLDLRLNYYLPLSAANELQRYRELRVNRNRFQIENVDTVFVETALGGFDAEIGGNAPFFKRLSAHAAYYYFSGKNSRSVSGFRVRSKLQATKNLHFEAEISHDKVRGIANYIGVGLSWNGKAGRDIEHLLYQKMTSVPVRDVDIVVQDGAFQEKYRIADFNDNGDLIIHEAHVQDINDALLKSDVILGHVKSNTATVKTVNNRLAVYEGDQRLSLGNLHLLIKTPISITENRLIIQSEKDVIFHRANKNRPFFLMAGTGTLDVRADMYGVGIGHIKTVGTSDDMVSIGSDDVKVRFYYNPARTHGRLVDRVYSDYMAYTSGRDNDNFEGYVLLTQLTDFSKFSQINSGNWALGRSLIFPENEPAVLRLHSNDRFNGIVDGLNNEIVNVNVYGDYGLFPDGEHTRVKNLILRNVKKLDDEEDDASSSGSNDDNLNWQSIIMVQSMFGHFENITFDNCLVSSAKPNSRLTFVAANAVNPTYKDIQFINGSTLRSTGDNSFVGALGVAATDVTGEGLIHVKGVIYDNVGNNCVTGLLIPKLANPDDDQRSCITSATTVSVDRQQNSVQANRYESDFSKAKIVIDSPTVYMDWVQTDKHTKMVSGSRFGGLFQVAAGLNLHRDNIVFSGPINLVYRDSQYQDGAYLNPYASYLAQEIRSHETFLDEFDNNPILSTMMTKINKRLHDVAKREADRLMFERTCREVSESPVSSSQAPAVWCHELERIWSEEADNAIREIRKQKEEVSSQAKNLAKDDKRLKNGHKLRMKFQLATLAGRIKKKYLGLFPHKRNLLPHQMYKFTKPEQTRSDSSESEGVWRDREEEYASKSKLSPMDPLKVTARVLTERAGQDGQMQSRELTSMELPMTFLLSDKGVNPGNSFKVTMIPRGSNNKHRSVSRLGHEDDERTPMPVSSSTNNSIIEVMPTESGAINYGHSSSEYIFNYREEYECKEAPPQRRGGSERVESSPHFKHIELGEDDNSAVSNLGADSAHSNSSRSTPRQKADDDTDSIAVQFTPFNSRQIKPLLEDDRYSREVSPSKMSTSSSSIVSPLASARTQNTHQLLTVDVNLSRPKAIKQFKGFTAAEYQRYQEDYLRSVASRAGDDDKKSSSHSYLHTCLKLAGYAAVLGGLYWGGKKYLAKKTANGVMVVATGITGYLLAPSSSAAVPHDVSTEQIIARSDRTVYIDGSAPVFAMPSLAPSANVQSQ